MPFDLLFEVLYVDEFFYNVWKVNIQSMREKNSIINEKN
jgi:hypothetical protein